jgi:hypothetical protein
MMGGECYANWTSLQRQLCSLLVLLFFYGLGTKYGRISAYCMNIRKRLYFAHLGLHDLSSFCVRALCGLHHACAHRPSFLSVAIKSSQVLADAREKKNILDRTDIDLL